MAMMAPTPEQCRVGKYHEHMGDPSNVKLDTDTMTINFCYCQLAHELRNADPMINDLGHVYSLEYFNRHSGYSFIACNLCETRWGDTEGQKRCGMSEDVRGMIRADKFMSLDRPVLVRSWPKNYPNDTNNVGDGEQDILTYSPYAPYVPIFRHPEWNDFFSFNGQWRRLGRPGGQGWWEESSKRTQAICQKQCQDHLGMDVVPNNQRPLHSGWLLTDLAFDLYPSRQQRADNLDDMCPDCA